MQHISVEIPVFEKEFKELVEMHSEKFEFVSLSTKNYLKKGFEGILKIKIPLKLTQKEFSIKNAKAKIINDRLFIQGYLREIDAILGMIH